MPVDEKLEVVTISSTVTMHNVIKFAAENVHAEYWYDSSKYLHILKFIMGILLNKALIRKKLKAVKIEGQIFFATVFPNLNYCMNARLKQ